MRSYAAIVRDVASSATPSSLPQTLLILSYLATSQRDNLTALAPEAFGHLSRLPNLASEVSKLTKQKMKASRFGYLLLCAAVEQAMSDAGGEVASPGNYDVLVKATAIGEYGSSMAAVFLEKATKPLKGAKKARLVEMMKLFDVYHCEAMDRAVNEYLAGDSGRSDSPDGRKHVLNVLEASLEDTVRAPLFDANVTLSAGIDHAQASIRIMALERLNEICERSDSKLQEEAQITLKGALSRRLEDDDMGVVLTVLNLSTLPDLLPEVVLSDALVQTIDRCITAVYDKNSGKRTRGLGRKAAKAALRRLGSLGGAGRGDAPARGAVRIAPRPQCDRLRRVATDAVRCVTFLPLPAAARPPIDVRPHRILVEHCGQNFGLVNPSGTHDCCDIETPNAVNIRRRRETRLSRVQHDCARPCAPYVRSYEQSTQSVRLVILAELEARIAHERDLDFVLNREVVPQHKFHRHVPQNLR